MTILSNGAENVHSQVWQRFCWQASQCGVTGLVHKTVSKIFQTTECLILDFYPELLSGALKVSSCSGHDLIFVDVDGKCQFSVGGAPFCS